MRENKRENNMKENTSLAGKTIVISGFESKGFGTVSHSYVSFRFNDDTEIEPLGEITLEDLGNLHRLIGANPTILSCLTVEDLQGMERVTLDKLGYDIEVGTQEFVLKVADYKVEEMMNNENEYWYNMYLSHCVVCKAERRLQAMR